MIKVDQHGCLTPGCHLPLSTHEGAPVKARILAYPNPAAHTLAVHLALAEKPHPQSELNLIDSGGRVVRRLPVRELELTYILPVENLPDGVYSLSYRTYGQLPVSQQIVITH